MSELFTPSNGPVRKSTRQRGLNYQGLEERNLLASIVFNPGNGIVSMTGDPTADTGTAALTSSTDVTFTLTGAPDLVMAQSAVTEIYYRGHAGDDVFTNSTAIPSRVFGDAGNDTLTGGDGEDRIQGGSGGDTIFGGLGNDYVDGNGGNDIISGGEGDDVLLGGADVDRVSGDDGNDLIFGREGNDALLGGNGVDRLYGEGGEDFLDGGDGNDFLFGNQDADFISGGEGDDLAYGGDANDQMYGGNGNDTLIGNDGDDIINGQNGDDIVFAAVGDDIVTGGAGNDQLFGQQGNDKISGNVGDDLINSGSGDDELRGGDGNDRLFAGEGNDRLLGEAGADTLVGGAGNDALFGGVNANAVDIMFGNEGKDRFLFFEFDNVVDKEAEDARLEFRDGNNGWTNREVEVIDDGLQLLMRRTGNTRLLKGTMTTQPLVFIKQLTIPTATQIASNTLVSVSDQVLDPVTGEPITVTKLERRLTFGNWDEFDTVLNDFYVAEIPRMMAYTWAGPTAVPNVLPSQTSFWDQFTLISGWTQERPEAIQFYDISGDNQWWFLKTSQFAQDFGKLNPDADWATAWRLYFESDSSSAEKLRLVNKMNKIDQLFSMLEIF